MVKPTVFRRAYTYAFKLTVVQYYIANDVADTTALLPGPCGPQVPHNQRHDPALDQALALDPQDGHDTAWRSISPHTIRSGFWKCGLTPRPENEDAASKMDEDTGVLDLLSSLEIAPTDLPVVLPSNEIDRDDDMELVIL
jgi:hypothetical protein